MKNKLKKLFGLIFFVHFVIRSFIKLTLFLSFLREVNPQFKGLYRILRQTLLKQKLRQRPGR